MPKPNVFEPLWRAGIRNLILGSAISVLPAFAFYYVAFSYTSEELSILLLLAPIPIATFLAVDLGLNRLYLAPVRQIDTEGRPSEEQLASAYRRIHNFPLFSFVRVFGPHAVSSTGAASLCTLYANMHWGLNIPRSDFWVYWLLNLTVVPIGHAVFEYHANGLAARRALRQLLRQESVPSSVAGLRRVRLAVRVAVLYALLGISPLIFLGVAARLGKMEAAATLGWSSLGIVVAGVGALNLLLLLLFAAEVAEQTRNLLGGLVKVESGNLDTQVEAFATDEFGLIANGVNKMIAGLRERQRLRDLFGMYMSQEVSQAILERTVNLQGESSEASILFCDIRNFTELCAGRSPAQVVHLLNRFFARMAEAVAAEGGTINKFLGEGFLAVFGAPVHFPDHARRSIQAALEMERQLEHFNREQANHDEPTLEIGVGIETGTVLTGNVGSESKIEYAVIGDTVNRASRIEQLNKRLGTRILISERTREAARFDPAQMIAPVAVRGVPEPLVVFAIGEKRAGAGLDPTATSTAD